MEPNVSSNGKRIRKRLTLENRIQIQNLLERGMKPDKIAEKIGIHETTVYREIRKCEGKYNAAEAHKNTYWGYKPIDYDIIGKTYGLLVVRSFEKKIGVRTWWRCECTCGNFCIMKRKMLLEYCSPRRPLSCGCEPKQHSGHNRTKLPFEELCHRKYLDLLKFRKINGECWEWTGYLQGGTTPKTSFRSVSMSVRKCMYLITHLIEDVDGIFYASCGNLLCINPDHITTQAPAVRAIRFKGTFPKKLRPLCQR